MKKVIALVLITSMLGSAALATAMSGNEEVPRESEKAKEFYAGREVKVVVAKDGYSLIDVKTGDTILYINYTAIEENLDGKPAITKNQAVKFASELCGPAYTLVRATENPYDFDILFERQIGGIAVFGETCYVSINKMTGKIAAYRKMPVREITSKPEVRISKDEVIKMTGAVDAKLMLIPEKGCVWITSQPNSTFINAATGKEMGKDEIMALRELYKTTVDFKGLRKISTEKDETVEVRGIDNDQGAVFRDDAWFTDDDIQAAEAAMEKERPNNEPAWDPNAYDAGVVWSDGEVNNILTVHEGVYYSGHGDDNCIYIGGDEKYCTGDVANGLQTRLFVITACYAGNNLAPTLVNKGVQCVIADDGYLFDFPGWSPCAEWADEFWDRATGNVDAGSQRTAHTARIEANNAVWHTFCDLDVERGNCNIYI